MFGFLTLMFFLGAIQLLWAVIHPIVTKIDSVRKHFIYYWIGVFAYFTIMAVWINVANRLGDSNLFIAYFFLGAWSLAIYHFGIIFTDGWHAREVEKALRRDAENQPKPFEA